ncbi:pseudouridine-5'-phosphatase-like isoform X1 [Microplitis mediator]|uniref:pseudouridine-5'-phosphatase-like isoform X1 n=1 Tax=Microplitis mediator TaxID=375433 RepID=UPI0025571027|nr:pseudouridine-5'-phosphatase-like isoform X1 [Microplitis mediator]
MADDYKKVTHVLFDMDGLLIDSESVYKTIYNKIVSEFGHSYCGDVTYQVLGRPEVVGIEIIIDYYKLPLSIEEVQSKYHQLQQELFVQVRLMPGAERLLRHLHKHNIPIALATSSSESSYELKTRNLKPIFELFHHRVLGGSDPDVKKGKPAPDIFLVAASRFSDSDPVQPSQCLVFEDAPNGVQAAVSAGMQVVMVPDENLPKELTKKATMVLHSLEEFKPELFGLPPFSED